MQEIVYSTDLFSNLSIEKFNQIYNELHFKVVKYTKGDLAGSIYQSENAIGIVIDGKIKAMKYLISGKAMCLKEMGVGEIFGIGSIFQEKDIRLSYLEVVESTTIAYLSQSELINLFRWEEVLLNYLVFINTKIQYLNHKIDLLSQTSIKDKVLMFLHDQQIIQGTNGRIRLPMNKKALADYLCVSRASLYRTFEELERESVIEMIDENIIVYL